jgi:hypothetical protein
MRTTVRCLTTALLFSFGASTADAESIVLPPEVVHVALDPAASEEPRLLLRFELPDELTNARIVDATLRVQIADQGAGLFTIGPVSGLWTENDSWLTVKSQLGADEAFLGRLNTCALASSGTEVLASDEAMSEISVNATDWVTEWATLKESNHGLCLRGPLDASGAALSTSLGDIGAVELVILYIP